jgi:hypothetical protein
MRAEMNAMRQAGAGAAVGAAPTGGDAPIAKPGLGLVCFCCGDAHHHSDCHWSG